MSFSSDMKAELAGLSSKSLHCQKAELFAILSMCGRVSIDGNQNVTVMVQTENYHVACRYCALLKSALHILPQVRVTIHGSAGQYTLYRVVTKDPQPALKITAAAGILGRGLEEIERENNFRRITEKACCKRAYLRGAFLAGGSVSDPQKFYHLEIVCSSWEGADEIVGLLLSFGIEGRITSRKKHYIVYLKEGDAISDFLNITEAHRALLEFENIRILRDIKGSINRKVNCETANIRKTVSASVRQREDIAYLLEKKGEAFIPEKLRETARLRLQYPDMPLLQLGLMHEKKVGKSGVNHRLRKLQELADEVRSETSGES